MLNSESAHDFPSLNEQLQIDSASGLSRDYLNEYNALIMNLDFYFHGNPDFLKQVLKAIEHDTVLKNGKLIYKYEERMAPTFPHNPINEENKLAAEKLNSIATECNKEFAQLFQNGNLSLDEKLKQLNELLKSRRSEVFKVIAGHAENE